ncbi:MAG TPA: cytochrome c oxidase subunit I [Longimicrobium sp.]|jgi:cytochrome c oxidase subunit 1
MNPPPSGVAEERKAQPPAGLLGERETAELDRVWRRKPGVAGWLFTTNHKAIAARYVVTTFVFLVLGGIEALLMRIQLARPENGFIGPDQYDQLFSTHGTTMMFLFAVPVMEAMALYFVPLMLGTRNVSFPRLNAFGYWVFLIGGVFLYVSLLTNSGPDNGWFNYVPLSGPEYAPGKRSDIWAQTITFTEIAALVAAIELTVTIFKMRAPGMSLNRIPLFVWSMLVTSFMVLFAMPTVASGSMMLAMDRMIGVGTHFFNPAEGGDALLWQHLFWFFGHPEVYIIFIPATGMVSAMLPAFTRREVFGYTAIVLSLVANGFVGFGLWVHHMFATPIFQMGQSFFTAASIMIAIPSGVQIFCWIATLWAGRPRFDTPLLFILGFIFLFVIGGVTGVMLASIPFDLQAHDTFFVVAHFHYVLIGGALFPLWAAFYYWFPKFTGRLMDERMGKVNFWLFFVGVNLTFFPMHFLGLMGMPRRVYTYLAGTGWGDLNLLATVGAFTIALSALVFVANVLKSLRGGTPAGDDPWGADSLEWATSSPPPSYNFLHIPVVQGRSPLWQQTADAPVVTGLRTDRREVLITSTMDADPEARHPLPGDTPWPFFAALATGALLIALVFTPWGAVLGTVLLFPFLVLWGLPPKRTEDPKG